MSNTDSQMRNGEVDLDNVDLDNGSRLVNPVVESLAPKGLIDSEELDTCLALQLSWSPQDLKGLGLMASDPAAFPAFIFRSRFFVWSVVRDRLGQGWEGWGGGGGGIEGILPNASRLHFNILAAVVPTISIISGKTAVLYFFPSFVDAEHSVLNIPL